MANFEAFCLNFLSSTNPQIVRSAVLYNPIKFSITDIYRTNMFHLTSTGCALVLQKDMEYWGIDELMMEPCCALKYYPEIETCVNEKQVGIILYSFDKVY